MEMVTVLILPVLPIVSRLFLDSFLFLCLSKLLHLPLGCFLIMSVCLVLYCQKFPSTLSFQSLLHTFSNVFCPLL